MTARVWEMNDDGMTPIGEVSDVDEQVGRVVVTLHPSDPIARVLFEIPDRPKPSLAYALTLDGRFAVLKSWTLDARPQLVTAVFVDTEMTSAA